jgi:glycosyltransferase involved in cell wall biosynthesis
MDFSTSWQNSAVGPVGILRCEYELARYLLQHHADEVVFAIFDPGKRGYRELSKNVVRALLTRTPGQARATDPLPRGPVHWARAAGASLTAGGYVAAAAIGGRVGGVTARQRWSNRATTYIARHRDYVRPGIFRALVPRFVPHRDAQIERLELLLSLLRSLDLPENDIPTQKGEVLKLGAFDVLILAGVFWSGDKAGTVAKLKRAGAKVRVFCLIYDMIPIKLPHLSEAVAADEFERALRHLIGVADGFACISKSTERDLREYLNAGDRQATTLQTRAIAIGPGPLVRYRAEGRLEAPNDARIRPGGFVVLVSTIEVRKNHAFAYQLWRRLAEKHGSAVPPLVFAGRRGWGIGSLLEIIDKDPVVGRKAIIHLGGVSDPKLAWLYANCAFTIFPSHYEGWGMPITESLAFGKACIASDNSSLREASQGLATHLDLLDGLGWVDAIEKHIFDLQFRADCERLITERFVPTTWESFGKHFMEMASPGSEIATLLPGS